MFPKSGGKQIILFGKSIANFFRRQKISLPSDFRSQKPFIGIARRLHPHPISIQIRDCSAARLAPHPVWRWCFTRTIPRSSDIAIKNSATRFRRKPRKHFRIRNLRHFRNAPSPIKNRSLARTSLPDHRRARHARIRLLKHQRRAQRIASSHEIHAHAALWILSFPLQLSDSLLRSRNCRKREVFRTGIPVVSFRRNIKERIGSSRCNIICACRPYFRRNECFFQVFIRLVAHFFTNVLCQLTSSDSFKRICPTLAKFQPRIIWGSLFAIKRLLEILLGIIQIAFFQKRKSEPLFQFSTYNVVFIAH